ncbi:hypothetical protein D3C76_972180 [compost metagenome]
MQRVKSEDKSDYVGYWLYDNGDIVKRDDSTVIPVYTNGTARLKNADGKVVVVNAVKLIASTFVPNPNGYRFIIFKDGNRNNRAASNLEWRYAVRELSDETREMIRLWELKTSTTDIAHTFGKTPQYVNRVIRDHKKRNALL